MPDITRRTLMREVGLAAPAVALGPAVVTQLSTAQDYPESVFHVFAFQWKPGTTEAQKTKAAKDIAAFQGKIRPSPDPRGRQHFSSRKRLHIRWHHAV